MLQVGELMSKTVETVRPDDDLDLAALLMQLDRVRHLPVVEKGKVIGILSDRDILRAQVSALHENAAQQIPAFNRLVSVREVMSTRVETIDATTSVREAAMLMKSKKLGCLPVTIDGELAGIITPIDLLGLIQEMV